jgi:hypothetical protein
VLVSSGNVRLGSDEGAFAIRAAAGPLLGSAWTTRLVTLDDEALADGDVLVNTGGQWGPFEVTTQYWDAEPDVENSWEDIVEFSVGCRDGGLVVTELVDNDPTAVLAEVAGTYRVRVSARGRSDAADDLDEDGNINDDPEPREFYLIQAWPAPMLPPLAIRETTPDPQEVADAWERSARTLPEADAGLAAARRIGRDVDRAEGARTLSGATGSISVARVLPGTRRRLFTRFANGVSWSPGVPSWSFMGGPDYLKSGEPEYAIAGDHEDQLSGRHGSIRVVARVVERPARVVRAWNWFGPPPAAIGKSVEHWIDFLPTDSLVSTTLTQSKAADGQTQTEVVIEHTGLPIEWLDDMRAWWSYQFAVAEFDESTRMLNGS